MQQLDPRCCGDRSGLWVLHWAAISGSILLCPTVCMLPFSNSPSLWETTTPKLGTYTLKIGNQVSVANLVSYSVNRDKLRLETSQCKKQLTRHCFAAAPSRCRTTKKRCDWFKGIQTSLNASRCNQTFSPMLTAHCGGRPDYARLLSRWTGVTLKKLHGEISFLSF